MTFASLAGHVVELLESTEQNTQPTDHTVAEFFRSRKYLGSHDRRFISQTVYGMVRFRKRLTLLVDELNAQTPFLPQPIPKEVSSFCHLLAYLAAIEEIDPQQFIEPLRARWERILPETKLEDVVYWLVRNKTLGFLRGDDIQQLAGWYSFEEWMVKEFVNRWGVDETEDLLHALNSEAPITLRVNTLKTDVDDCRIHLQGEGIETTKTRYSPTALIAAKRFNQQSSETFKKGWFEMQDEGSQIVCYLVAPEPGQFVVDACAGAGGKTLMMADLMHNEGEIIALDRDRKRLKELEKRAVRAGVGIIVTGTQGKFHPGDLLGKADRVLVDAPCSGVGTIRRNPSLKWSVTPESVDAYAAQQRDILETNASYVKRGGRLVYATCSLLSRENENVVGHFLETHTDFVPLIPHATLTRLGLSTTAVQSTSGVTLLPHRHGTDGFFVAVLQRKK